MSRSPKPTAAFATANSQAGIGCGSPYLDFQPVFVSGSPGGRHLNPPPSVNNGNTGGVPRAFAYPEGPIQALGRNSIVGFGAWQADVSAERPVWERDSLHVSLRMDAYNALNHAQFADPERYWSNPMFGQSQAPACPIRSSMPSPE